MPTIPGSMAKIILRFLEVHPSECQRFLTRHRELLTDHAEAVLAALEEEAEKEDAASPKTEHVRKRRWLLERCRLLGIDETFNEVQEIAREGTLAISLSRLAQQSKYIDQGWDVFIRDVLENPDTSGSPEPTVLHMAGLALLHQSEEGADGRYLDGAIRLWHTLVDRTPSGSSKLPDYLSDLGGAYGVRHHRTGTQRDRESVSAAWRNACKAGLDTSPELVLDVAGRWAGWAKSLDAWAEAAEAYGYGLSASERLVRSQLTRHGKETWLRKARGLALEAAYALAMNGQATEAVVALERGRAVLVTESLQRARLDLGRINGELAQRYVAAVKRVRRLEALASRRFAPPPSLREQRVARDDLDRVVKEIQKTAESFLADPTYDRIVETAQPVPIVYLTSTDRGGVALVVYKDHSCRVIWLPILTSYALHEKVLEVHGKATEYEVRLHRDEGLDPKDAVKQAGQTIVPAMCRWLWDSAMGPLLKEINDPGIVLIPSGILAVWPLHAAWVPDTTMPSGRRYALDVSCITYAPNSRILRESQLIAAKARADSVLVVEEPKPTTTPQLDFARFEATAVMDSFPKSSSRLIRGTDATLQSVQKALGKHPVLHFCCHGKANPDEPFSSGLVMAYDGWLTIRDMLEMQSSCLRLGVLSACETNLPGLELPDEVVSLPTIMLQAGFGAVIGTFSTVPDISSMVLMSRFYELWRGEGSDLAEALRQAQRWVRDATNKQLQVRFPNVPRLAGPSRGEDLVEWEKIRPFRHPDFWAPFAYVGA